MGPDKTEVYVVAEIPVDNLDGITVEDVPLSKYIQIQEQEIERVEPEPAHRTWAVY